MLLVNPLFEGGTGFLLSSKVLVNSLIPLIQAEYNAYNILSLFSFLMIGLKKAYIFTTVDIYEVQDRLDFIQHNRHCRLI